MTRPLSDPPPPRPAPAAKKGKTPRRAAARPGREAQARPATAAGAAPRPPRGVAPAAWALRCALVTARDRLAWATAEAHLVDGLRYYVQLECTAPPCGRSLPPSGPRWAAALAAVAACARLCSPGTQAVLAEWTAQAPAAGAPSGADTVDFRPFGV